MYSHEGFESLHLLVESLWCLPRTPRSFKTPDKAAPDPKRAGYGFLCQVTVSDVQNAR